MNSTLKLAIIADDLTGSADSAVQFVKKGMVSAVAVPGVSLCTADNCEVLVVDSETRDISATEAFDRVRKTVHDLLALKDDLLIYKKVDSTLRGNIGAELEAAYTALSADFILFSPAFIPSGRTTVDGVQYLNGARLEDTELSRVPKSPVTTSEITEIIARESSLSCALVGLEDLNRGPLAVKEKIKKFLSQGARIIITDATKEEHQLTAVQAVADLGRVLYSGSAGLAYALSSVFTNRTLKTVKPKAENVLVLAGSISAVTRAQSRHLIANTDCTVISADPEQSILNPYQSAQEVAAKIRGRVHERNIVLVSAAPEESDVRKSAKVGEQAKLSFFEVGERMACFMAELMKNCADCFDAFIITGGDTAIHACHSCSATLLEVLQEIEPGIPLTRVVHGPLKNHYLVTKAGAFGKESAFTEACELLTSKA
ncbi:MAG: four-carbon acid sugar kinase family protein [Succinivibrio sp.]|nr:four-carbon acid sugar kinase family protein [Succinivibrio sp.]